VAAAGATSTGLHDDLEAIGGFCRERGIWLHADAAHGASALLSPAHRGLHRAGGLGRLGRAQDAAHIEPLRGDPGA
jgi:glutamate/tyrosine decarboxylase-like PLP-dependent enzyme